MAENTDDRIRLTLSRSTGFTLDVDLTLPNGGVTVLLAYQGAAKPQCCAVRPDWKSERLCANRRPGLAR